MTTDKITYSPFTFTGDFLEHYLKTAIYNGTHIIFNEADLIMEESETNKYKSAGNATWHNNFELPSIIKLVEEYADEIIFEYENKQQNEYNRLRKDYIIDVDFMDFKLIGYPDPNDMSQYYELLPKILSKIQQNKQDIEEFVKISPRLDILSEGLDMAIKIQPKLQDKILQIYNDLLNKTYDQRAIRFKYFFYIFEKNKQLTTIAKTIRDLDSQHKSIIEQAIKIIEKSMQEKMNITSGNFLYYCKPFEEFYIIAEYISPYSDIQQYLHYMRNVILIENLVYNLGYKGYYNENQIKLQYDVREFIASTNKTGGNIIDKTLLENFGKYDKKVLMISVGPNKSAQSIIKMNGEFIYIKIESQLAKIIDNIEKNIYRKNLLYKDAKKQIYGIKSGQPIFKITELVKITTNPKQYGRMFRPMPFIKTADSNVIIQKLMNEDKFGEYVNLYKYYMKQTKMIMTGNKENDYREIKRDRISDNIEIVLYDDPYIENHQIIWVINPNEKDAITKGKNTIISIYNLKYEDAILLDAYFKKNFGDKNLIIHNSTQVDFSLLHLHIFKESKYEKPFPTYGGAVLTKEIKWQNIINHMQQIDKEYYIKMPLYKFENITFFNIYAELIKETMLNQMGGNCIETINILDLHDKKTEEIGEVLQKYDIGEYVSLRLFITTLNIEKEKEIYDQPDVIDYYYNKYNKFKAIISKIKMPQIPTLLSTFKYEIFILNKIKEGVLLITNSQLEAELLDNIEDCIHMEDLTIREEFRKKNKKYVESLVNVIDNPKKRYENVIISYTNGYSMPYSHINWITRLPTIIKYITKGLCYLQNGGNLYWRTCASLQSKAAKEFMSFLCETFEEVKIYQLKEEVRQLQMGAFIIKFENYSPNIKLQKWIEIEKQIKRYDISNFTLQLYKKQRGLLHIFSSNDLVKTGDDDIIVLKSFGEPIKKSKTYCAIEQELKLRYENVFDKAIYICKTYLEDINETQILQLFNMYIDELIYLAKKCGIKLQDTYKINKMELKYICIKINENKKIQSFGNIFDRYVYLAQRIQLHIKIMEQEQFREPTEVLRGKLGHIIQKKYGLKYKPTNAFLKLYEILEKENILPLNKNINAMYLAEAPGNFILATQFYLKQKGYGHNFDWRANTLNDKSNPEALGDSYGLIKNNKNKWLWGIDGTGNILLKENIEHIKKQMGFRADLLTGDIGLHFDVLSEENIKLLHKLELAQTLAIIKLSSKGSNCVAKHFLPFIGKNAFEYIEFGFDIINIYKMFFETVLLIKPENSRRVSGEFYIVGKNFKDQFEIDIDFLYEKLNKFNNKKSIVANKYENSIAEFYKELMNINIEYMQMLEQCINDKQENDKFEINYQINKWLNEFGLK